MIDLQETVNFMFNLTFIIGLGTFLFALLRWFIFDYLDLFLSDKDKYPNAAHRIENGSFKGSTTPTSSQPDAPQPPECCTSEQNKQVIV